MQKQQEDNEPEPPRPRLSLKRETLWRLTPAELQLVAGGDGETSSYFDAAPTT